MLPALIVLLIAASDPLPIPDRMEPETIRSSFAMYEKSDWGACMGGSFQPYVSAMKPVQFDKVLKSCASKESAALAMATPEHGVENAESSLRNVKVILRSLAEDLNRILASKPAIEKSAASPHRELRNEWKQCASPILSLATMNGRGWDFLRQMAIDGCKDEEEALRGTMVREFGSRNGEAWATDYMQAFLARAHIDYIQSLTKPSP
jgi:hypothetical protein